MPNYCSLDGDKIGTKLEKLIVNQDMISLSKFSNLISEAINDITKKIKDKGYNIVFSGGDNIMFHGEIETSFCDEISEYFENKTSNNLSIGIGNTMKESFIALKIAKAKGGAVIIKYWEEMRP